ncbi:PREDICTED: uncharacterized protein LOC106747419 [Dinoponera quadriceps]|uniref:Uncharacterized protein LOC106747419 n=1 Tax=Dinoponera quadriceps TaxID=609295 RepID=A0A6P3XQA9_DINQU|nr:PREDICTED: uncharacterized protein LOC106747419 [Dinoponera quadriceps]
MAKAIKAVWNKTYPAIRAAKRYKVPYSTLYKMLNAAKPGSKDPLVIIAGRRERNGIFPKELEKTIMEYCLLIKKKFYEISCKDIRRLAYQMTIKSGITTTFHDSMAGRQWFYRFMSRHSNEPSVGRSKITSLERISNFFDLLEMGDVIRQARPNWTLFTEWFSHFIEKTRPTAESPVLLILDCHYTHRNLDVILKARDNHVNILGLPNYYKMLPNPVEKAFLFPLRRYYNEYITNTLEKQKLYTYDIARQFGKAYLATQRMKNPIDGFKLTGIYLPRNCCRC